MTTALGAVFLHVVREMEKNDGGGDSMATSSWRGVEMVDHLVPRTRSIRICKAHRSPIEDGPGDSFTCPVGPHVLVIPSETREDQENFDRWPFEVVTVKAPATEMGPPPPAAPIREVPIHELRQHAAEEVNRMPKVDRAKMRHTNTGRTVRCSRCHEPGHNARGCKQGSAEKPPRSDAGAATGATGATAAPTRARKPRPAGERTVHEFHDEAGSRMKLELKPSKRIPFAVRCTYKKAGAKGTERGNVQVCGSREEATGALQKLVDAALEDGWRVGRTPVKLMELPKPLRAPKAPGRGRKK